MPATRSLERLAPDLAVGVGFFVLAGSGVALTRFEGGAAFVWVATALLFARLSLLPFAGWPAPVALCAIASAAVSTLFGVGPVRGVPLAIIVVAEAVATAWLLRRWLGHSAYYETAHGLFAFTIVAVAVPMASAVGAYGVLGWLAGAPFWPVWFAWFTAHSLGTLAFAPVFMLAMRGEFRRWRHNASRRRRVEAAGVFLAVAAAIGGVFAQGEAALLFLPALPVMVATLRFGRAGAAVSIVLLAAIGGAYTMRGHGPIGTFGGSTGARIQLFQLYLAVLTLLVLPVAALMKQHREIQDRLTESETRYRLIAEHSGDMILNLSVDGMVLYASPAVTPIAGYAPSEMIGHHAAEFIHDADVERVVAVHRHALACPEANFTVEYRAITARDGLRWCETNMRAVCDASGRVTGALSAVRDISVRKATEAQLSADANTDPLTGLPNRRAFAIALEERLHAVRDGEAGAALAMFDIDFFKAINDRHGHAAGDAVLVAFAKTARRSLRQGDCLARIGGEEFGLVLTAATPDEAEMVCERLRRALSRAPVTLAGGACVTVTVSAGVVALSVADDADAALRQADAALYTAKETGRDRLVRAA